MVPVYKILLAIDFGTTFSGCAYVHLDDTEVCDFTEWPIKSTTYSKTPTACLYRLDNNGNPCLYSWGTQAKKDEMDPILNGVLLQKFKLRLDENLSLDPMPIDVDVVQAIADYLRCLYRHVSEKIISNYGYQIDRDMFRFCLTVPAMWSDRAKDATRQAAILAGLVRRNDHPDRLLLVTEPEAAALYCQLKCKQFNLEHGDQFMVCDAGGGTVDLIVYEIEDTADGRRLSEVTQGQGASCGSTFVDQRFQSFLRIFFQNYGVVVSDRAMSILTDKFIEKVKPNINLEYSFQLDIPGDPCFDRLPSSGVSELEDGGLTLHCDQLRRDIFDPEIGNVIDLIKQQLLGAKSCKGIFLVGGFGSSDYLQGCIRDALGDTSVSLFMPADAEMAVVRGAVYSGLNMDSINTRVARRSYGLNLAKPFREDVDPTSNLWELPDGRRLCKDRFVCMVRKGEKMNGDRVHDIPILISKGQYECSETFICAYDGSDGIPEYTTSSGVVRLGKIKVRGLFKETDPDGTEAKGTLRLYLGQCEIKATVILSNSSYSTRVAFDTTEVSR